MTTVLVLIAVIMGAISYAGLGLRLYPEVEFPMAVVVTAFPGGSPAEIETQITKPVEDAVRTIPGIDELTSVSRQGVSEVQVQFDMEEDIDVKTADIRDRLDRVKGLLPEDAEDPFVLKFSLSQQPVIILALTGSQHINELHRIADEELDPVISQVRGVADVQLTGGQEREIQVLLEARKLRKYRVPIGTVGLALRNANLDVPGGHITQAGREYVIRSTSRFQEVSEIAEVRVPTASGSIITVGDLGRVVDTYAEQRTRSRFRGEDTILLSVVPQSDVNQVDVADGVKALLPRLQGMLPGGAVLSVSRDDSVFVRGALDNVKSNMKFGILLTALTLYLFLHSWRATVIVAVVIPAAVLTTFLGLMASGFTLNMMSLTGLALVIGVLVNNSILIVENVSRFLDDGLPPVQAAVAGTKDIALAILSSTVTNLVVFLPLAFMGEIIGKFFKELGLTVVYATVVSLLASLTLSPMMCALLLRRRTKGTGWFAMAGDLTFGLVAGAWQKVFGWGKDVYLHMLGGCLRWRHGGPVVTLLVTFVLFSGAIVVFRDVISKEFVPAGDEGIFRVVVQTPIGTPLAVTDGIVSRVEHLVATSPGVKPYLRNYSSTTGHTSVAVAGVMDSVNLAEVFVTVVDREERDVDIDHIMNELRRPLADLPSAKITVEKGQGWQPPIMIEIAGDDLEQIRDYAADVIDIVTQTPGTAGINKSYQPGQPEIRISGRREAARVHMVSVGLIGEEVRTYIEGREFTEFRDKDETYDIRVRLREEDRDLAEDVGRMFVSAPASGQLIPIGEVARVEEGAGPTVITRKDGRRLITVTSSLTGEVPLGDVVESINDRLAEDLPPPPGVVVTMGGEAEDMQKNMAELFKAMAIAAVLTFLCVAGIIESFVFALIICMALPICLIGVVVAMLIGGVTLNIFSAMAFVILIGMVINNAIIVIDYAVRHESPDRTPEDVITEACSVRFRMILMANLTTIVALIPLSLGRGFGGVIFQPLAIVEMGGVLAAAGLSLLVIPVVYVMARRGQDLARRATAWMRDDLISIGLLSRRDDEV